MKNLILFLLLLSVQPVAAQTSNTSSTTSTQVLVPSKSEDSILVRFEPHWLALRELTVDFQVLVSDKFSIGPTLAYMHDGDGIYYRNKVADRTYYNDRTYRQTYGLRAAYYFVSAQESSPLVSVFGKHRKSHIEIQPDPWEFSMFVPGEKSGTADFSENTYGITAGYQWVWMDFLNLTVAGGAAYFDTPASIAMKYSDGTTFDYQISDSEKVSYSIDVSIGLKF